MFKMPNPLALASMLGKLKDIPDRMKLVLEQMKAERISGASTCGHVTVIVNGIGEVQAVEMHTITVSGEVSVETVSIAVRDATNRAGAAAKERFAAAVADAANEMDIQIPGIEAMLLSLSGKG